MRKHQLVACGVVLLGTVTVAAALAQGGPPGAPSARGKAVERAPGPAGKGSDHDKGERGHADHDKGEHGKPGKPEKAGEPGAKPDDAGDKSKPHGKWRGHGALRDLLDELRTGKLKKGDVKERLAKLRESQAERRAAHQADLKTRWGAALAQPAVRQELEHHARRMARLNRAAFLVETEITKDKDKLVERIQKLIDKEQARHERAMERFKSTPPGASAAPAASMAPAAASAKAGGQ